jgi:hypothetical protein
MIQQDNKITGVVIGLLVGVNKTGEPLVAFADNLEEIAMSARCTTVISAEDTGREVALMFEDGDLKRPLIIGLIQHPGRQEADKNVPMSATIDDEDLILSAKRSITLKCGKSSITLTKAGKLLIRGSYILSRSSGANRIKGGSVQIN